MLTWKLRVWKDENGKFFVLLCCFDSTGEEIGWGAANDYTSFVDALVTARIKYLERNSYKHKGRALVPLNKFLNSCLFSEEQTFEMVLDAEGNQPT